VNFDVARANALLDKIGAVPEIAIIMGSGLSAVDEILTGRENLVLVAQLRHLKGSGRIADDLLNRFSLTDASARNGVLSVAFVDEGATPGLVRALVGAGAAIAEVRRKAATLEDVYFEVMGATPAADTLERDR